MVGGCVGGRAACGPYQATFKGDALKDLRPIKKTLDERAMVVHGLTVDGTYVGSLPVACGTIEPAG